MLLLSRSIAPCRAAPAVALAAFTAALTAEAGAADAGGLLLLQVTPGQDFGPSDGRPMDVPAWRMSGDIAARVIEAFNATRQPLVIDFEHQTLNAEANGQPAPAAGWMHALRWIDGRGLYAEVELTERARALVAAGEYRYFSPVLEYDRASGDIVRVLMGALTNHPAIHGMDAVSLLAAASARFVNTTTGGHNVNPLLEKLLAALGLPQDTTEEAALQALADIKAELQAAYKELSIDDQAGAEGIAAACARLRAAGAPDPARYVPVGVLADVQQQLAALSAQVTADKASAAIEAARQDGRLITPEQEAHARSVAGTGGLAALHAFLGVLTPIAALTGTQTGGRARGADGDPAGAGLTDAERQVAAACGLTPEQFATGRAA